MKQQQSRPRSFYRALERGIMAPIDEAKQMFDLDLNANVSFEVVLSEFIMNPGCVVYTGADAIGMAKLCRKDMPWTILNPKYIELDPDMWFVWMLVGRGAMDRLFKMLPYRMPWVGFQRHGRCPVIKYYRTEDLERRFGGE